MKIAVFGWYGHNNAGDERIKFCLNHFLMSLGGIKNIDFFDLHEYAIKGATNQFDHYDLVIVGGGGLILSHYNYHDFILGIKTKLITIGISVETELKGNPKKFAIALLEKSKVFLVRDNASYEKLKKIDINDKVQVSTDLTFLHPYDISNIYEENNIGINLMAKTKCLPWMLKYIVFVSRFVNNFSPKTIDFSCLIKYAQTLSNILPIPLYCVEQSFNVAEYQMNDIKYLKKYFENVPSFFNHSEIDRCKIFISMRLHGLIFAVQKGIPILAFSIYPKQIHFIRDVGIENCLVNTDELKNTQNTMNYIFNNQDSIRKKILLYRDNAIENVKKNVIDAINNSLFN